MLHNRYIHLILGSLLVVGMIIWNTMKGELTVNEKALFDVVSDLSAEEMDGRMAGTPGYEKAADYVAMSMRNIGLKPFVEGSYFQFLETESNTFTGKPLVRFLFKGTHKVLELGKDYLFRGLSGAGVINQAELIFCGYGISAPEQGYDDYANLEVKGKVVVLVKENPKWNIKGLDLSLFSTRYKTKTAIEKGALAVVYVNSIHQEYMPKPIGSVLDGKGKYDQNIPQLHIERAVINTLLETMGESLLSCQRTIDSLKRPFSFSLPVRTDIQVKANYIPNAISANVLGWIEGSDSVLKNEYVVVAAHLDHVGRQADDFYFPGANDNASGVAALLEIADMMHLGELAPERSVIFAAFTGEESGLKGAGYFVEQWPLENHKIVAMLNMDCIAHGDSIEVFGGDLAMELWKSMKYFDKEMNALMVDQTASSNGCDAEPFNRIGVPTLSVVSISILGIPI